MTQLTFAESPRFLFFIIYCKSSCQSSVVKNENYEGIKPVFLLDTVDFIRFISLLCFIAAHTNEPKNIKLN